MTLMSLIQEKCHRFDHTLPATFSSKASIIFGSASCLEFKGVTQWAALNSRLWFAKETNHTLFLIRSWLISQISKYMNSFIIIYEPVIEPVKRSAMFVADGVLTTEKIGQWVQEWTFIAWFRPRTSKHEIYARCRWINVWWCRNWNNEQKKIHLWFVTRRFAHCARTAVGKLMVLLHKRHTCHFHRKRRMSLAFLTGRQLLFIKRHML